MASGFLDKTRLKAEDLIRQSYEYLSKQYGDVGGVFTPASPFGQLLSVVANTFELEMTYLEHAVNESNMETAQSDTAIYGLAALTGHDAYRGRAARGVIRIRKNPSENTGGEDSDTIRINNRSVLTFGGGSMQYFLNFTEDYLTIGNNGDAIETEVIQGIVNTQRFVADGTDLQSYNVTEKYLIDHDGIDVYVNGRKWTRRDSLYDCGYDAEEYVCRTSSTGGIALFFGNKDMGRPPANGAEIRVEYITHSGQAGNISATDITVEFGTAGLTLSGEEIDLNKCCSVELVAPPLMGCNAEEPALTKMLAPKASRSFVLANPESCQLYLGRFPQFSCVKAYNTKDDQYIEDDNIIYLTVLPNLLGRISSNAGGYDYFSLPLDQFVLSDAEKTAVARLFEDSGRLTVGTEIKVNDKLEVRRYAAICIVKAFENADKGVLRSTIRERFGTYFLNINRFDFIPKSDLIAMLEGVDGIDAADVYFISEANEEAIRNGYYMKATEVINPESHLREVVYERVVLEEGEDPSLGFDSYGNILLGDGLVCAVRGGFPDRNGVMVSDSPDAQGISSLTIVFDDDTQYSLYNKQKQKILNDILRG